MYYHKDTESGGIKYVASNIFLTSQVAEQISKVQGVKKVLVAQHDSYKGFLPGM